jgi:hypothetical protein
MVIVIGAAAIAYSLTSRGAELKQDTLSTWDEYVQGNKAQMGSPTSFLWADQQPERLQRLRNGEILVSSAAQPNPRPVPSGLIHDWVGAVFLPDIKIEDVLSEVRDYDNYKAYYKPTVVDSQLISSAGPCQKYSMRVVNKEVVAQTALEMDYETCYFKVDESRWYSTTRTTSVREIKHYGQANEEELPPDQGSGYIWRLYSVARFEQRDGGTYIEVEAMALSRDIPVAVRWLANPIVRRVSRNSMLLSLKETKDGVRSTETANKNVKEPATSSNRAQGGFGPDATAMNRFAPAGKP